MNIQQMYTKMFMGLQAQDWSRSVGGMQVTQYTPDVQRCLLRNPEGLKCAIGHLIPDELYTPALERERISGILQLIGCDIMDYGTMVSSDLYAFVLKAQAAHDNNEHPERMRASFIALGHTFNLVIPKDVP